jgi:nucleoid DNA-binding protein
MDIDLLSKMVKELILDRDEVNLPGVGTFVAELVPATFSDKGYTINPPYRRLYFVQSQETGDTAIAELYSKSNNVEESKAKKIIIDFLSEMMEVLKEKKVIIFPGLGRLRATRENNFFFVADEDLDIFPSGFGLEPISLKSHEETAAEVSAAIQGLSSIVNDKPEAAPSAATAPSASAAPSSSAAEPAAAPTSATAAAVTTKAVAPVETPAEPAPVETPAEAPAEAQSPATSEAPATEEPAPVEHPVDAETPAATVAPEETPAETETPAQTNEPVSTADEAEAEKPTEAEEVTKEATEETEAEEKPAAAVEAPSETEPARESVEPETETKPEQEAQTESEAKAEAEPETIAAPETKSETETEPETKTEHESESSAESKPETEAAAETKPARKPMSLGVKILIWTLSIIIGLLLLWILIGHLAPDFVDKILFNEEELEIINYTLPQS